MIIKKGFILMITSFILIGCNISNSENSELESSSSTQVVTSWNVSKTETDQVMANYNLENKTLTLSGLGETLDYKITPWDEFNSQIEKIVIGDGITLLGNNLFYNCNVETIVVPSSVTEIKEYVFNEKTNVFCQSSSIIGGTASNIYYYSDTIPTQTNCWHYINEVPTIWQAYHVLFVGNSFTHYNSMPVIFENIGKNLNINVEADMLAPSSYRLNYLLDPADENRTLLLNYLNSNTKYDYVVLQEQSTLPIRDYASFEEGVKGMCELIKQYQPTAKVFLYQTWGYSASDPDVSGMELKLRTAYETVAKKYDLGLSYVGKVFNDYVTSKQMLNLYYWDNSHPSYYGSYLAATVHIISLFNVDPRECTYLGTISDKLDAQKLLNAAYNSLLLEK